MPIRSDDVNAVELLKAKIARLEGEQAKMKKVNAYYRKYGTLHGCEELTETEKRDIELRWGRGWYKDVAFPAYELSNNNANIRRLKSRVDEIEKEALRRECADLRGDDGTEEHDGFTVVENREENRVQFIFNGKPSEGTRETLKMWGFKWAPSKGAWQRMLNSNGRYAAKMVVKAIEG